MWLSKIKILDFRGVLIKTAIFISVCFLYKYGVFGLKTGCFMGYFANTRTSVRTYTQKSRKMVKKLKKVVDTTDPLWYSNTVATERELTRTDVLNNEH